MNSFQPEAQRGGTFLGLVLGVLLGLGISLAVAVYVTKVPIPFVDRGVSGSVEADKAEMVRNKNWDPNAAVVKVEPPKDLAGINLPEGVDPPPIPSDSANASFYQDISEKITDMSSHILFFELEINKITSRFK